MADNFSFCLLGAMDRLWFNQIILFSSEPFPLFFPQTLKPVQLLNSESISTNTSTTPSSTQSFSSIAQDSPTSSPSLDDGLRNEEKEEEGEEEVKRRPTRVSMSCSRSSRSHSSSPSSSTQKRDHHHHHHKKNQRRSSVSCSPGSYSTGSRLEKSMSCRSLKDLELEEVKGFMDLGFIFKKEHLNRRMISVVPGLLRLGLFKTSKHKTDQVVTINNVAAADDHDDDEQLAKGDDVEVDVDDDIEREEEEAEKGVMRPYLSEAWLIKRPDSPLLNLRVPRVYAAADMKKHLKFWARTVASEVQQAC